MNERPLILKNNFVGYSKYVFAICDDIRDETCLNVIEYMTWSIIYSPPKGRTYFNCVIFCQEYTWTQKVQKSNDANENEKSSVELILSLGEENLSF